MQQTPSEAPIYILGAGPAGLAAAYVLTQAGQPVVVIERESRVGGLAKSIYYRDFILDLGPHRFFTKIPPVLQLWHEVLGPEQVTINRLTRIYYRGKYFQYPVKAFEVLQKVGIWESTRIVASYLWAQLFPNRDPHNFAEWVQSKFGTRLFQIFFERYTEKLWGIPCTDISAEWAAQRIKGLSLLKAIRTAVLGNDGRVKTLIDQFQFPRLGSGQLYDRIAAELERKGQTILTHTEVIRVEHENFHVQRLTLRDRATGEERTVPCTHVISSIPISILIQQLDQPPPELVVQLAKDLKFRNTILIYLLVEGSSIFPDNWLYINEPNVQLGRVTNFANWSPDMLANPDQTPLCCEYWCNFDDPFWQESEAKLLERAESDLRQIKLLQDQPIVGGFAVRLPRTYPIYAGNYKTALAEIQAYLQQFNNLQLIGRYGAFKYNNQDHSLLMGILAAENVLTPGKHNLWSVNSDSEYQEEARSDAATSLDSSGAQDPVKVGSETGTKREAQVDSQLGSNGVISSGSTSDQPLLKKLLHQFIAYLFTGGAATILDVLVFSILTSLGMWYISAVCLSYFLGLTTNFWLSRRFVFGVYWGNWLIQYVVFTCVALNSFLANLGLLQLFINELAWNEIPARIVSAGCVAILSFTGHKLYSFRTGSADQPQPSAVPLYRS